jgi:pimeloyl-ACP methyl ester carboxylesterase
MRHVDAAGPLDAPAIVFVHGSVVTRKMWLPQLRGLADAYRVIAADLPGHGALADQPFTFDAAVRSVTDVIDRHARGRALVAGLSLGGYLAIELASRHPARVAGLALSGCTVNFTGLLGLYLQAVSAAMRRGWLTQSVATSERKTRRLFPPALSDVAAAQLAAGVYPAPLGPAFAELAGRDFKTLLRSYPGPCLILNGERDRASRRGEKAFAAVLQRGRVEVLAGAGHACSLDQHDAYNQVLRSFAATIDWDASGNDQSSQTA